MKILNKKYNGAFHTGVKIGLSDFGNNITLRVLEKEGADGA
jgi:hypothetical protein